MEPALHSIEPSYDHYQTIVIIRLSYLKRNKEDNDDQASVEPALHSMEPTYDRFAISSLLSDSAKCKTSPINGSSPS